MFFMDNSGFSVFGFSVFLLFNDFIFLFSFYNMLLIVMIKLYLTASFWVYKSMLRNTFLAYERT